MYKYDYMFYIVHFIMEKFLIGTLFVIPAGGCDHRDFVCVDSQGGVTSHFDDGTLMLPTIVLDVIALNFGFAKIEVHSDDDIDLIDLVRKSVPAQLDYNCQDVKFKFIDSAITFLIRKYTDM